MSFTAENKILPGVYTNFVTALAAFTPGQRGVVALPAVLPWGEPDTVLEVEETTAQAKLGYQLSEAAMLPLRLILGNAYKVLVYRLNRGVQAAYGEEEGVSLLAAWGGSRGNDLTVKIATEEAGTVQMTTYLAGTVVDVQSISSPTDFHPRGWVVFGENSTLTPGSYALTGGDDGLEEEGALDRALDALVLHEAQTLCTWGVNGKEAKAKVIAFADRALAEDRPLQCVVVDAVADNQNILSVRQSLRAQDGTLWAPETVCCWLAGFTAGAKMSESGTYAIVDGVMEAVPRYTHLMQEQAVLEGQCVFDRIGNTVRLVYDINTRTSVTEKTPESLRKNKILRVIYTVDSDIKALIRQEFLGKTPNSADGRSQIAGRIAEYLLEVQRQGAIEDFAADRDLQVLAGKAVDAILVNYSIRPVDTGDKYYLTAEVR